MAAGRFSRSGVLADFPGEEINCNFEIKRVRGDTFGYLQRSFIGCVSGVDQSEVGEKAMQITMWRQANGSVAIKRTGFYSLDCELLSLDAVVDRTRTTEDEFITVNGADVIDACRLYLRPLPRVRACRMRSGYGTNRRRGR